MNNNEPSNQPMREAVLARIKRGDVRMRPQWRFALFSTLGILGIAIVLLALLYLSSFIVFTLHATGAWFVPVFGFRGVAAFFRSTPWILVIAAGAFAALLEFLAARYAFRYRKPMLVSLVAILAITFAGSAAIARTGLHEKLLWYASEKRLPVAGPFYRGFSMHEFRDIHPGVITEFSEDGFHMLNHRGDSLRIVIDEQTRLPFGADFRAGDRVVIFGERDDGTVRAFGIRGIGNRAGRDPGRRNRFVPFSNPPKPMR